MAKQSAIQKNNNRKVLIDRLSEKRKKLKSLLSSKELPFEERVNERLLCLVVEWRCKDFVLSVAGTSVNIEEIPLDISGKRSW